VICVIREYAKGHANAIRDTRIRATSNCKVAFSATIPITSSNPIATHCMHLLKPFSVNYIGDLNQLKKTEPRSFFVKDVPLHPIPFLNSLVPSMEGTPKHVCPHTPDMT